MGPWRRRPSAAAGSFTKMTSRNLPRCSVSRSRRRRRYQCCLTSTMTWKGTPAVAVKTMGMMPPPPPGMSAAGPPADTADEAPKPSITDLMKNPSKVVLCKNMVGPGEVDPDLEPEVKEECNGKYGDVNKVVIFEMPNVTPEEAVRIFIEFKRVESAIKAVVDLNGRFFGGREVQARFYDQDKFSNLSLYN